MIPGTPLAGSYDDRLVVLSVAISVLAAYAALDLTELVAILTGWARMACLFTAAAVMGIGLCAMHFVGLAALHLPLQVLYDWPTVLLALGIATLGSGLCFSIVSRRPLGPGRAVAGSLLMGGGISGMHFVAMAATRLPARIVYSPWLVALSIALTVAISFAALELAFARLESRERWSWQKPAGALMLGASVPAMHYLAMASASFIAAPSLPLKLAHAVAVPTAGLAVVCLGMLAILGQALTVSSIDKRFSRHARQLAESKRQLQAIFDNLTEGVVVVDRDRGIVQVNEAALRHFGPAISWMSLEQALGAIDMFLPNGELLPLGERPAARALRGDFVRDYEAVIRRKGNGQTSICEINTAPIARHAGETQQVIIGYRDITERKHSEEARTRLVAIVESSEDAIIGKDLDGMVTSWNKGAEKMFGYTAQEMVGQPIRTLLPEDHADEEAEILARIRRGERVEHIETVRRKKNGQLIQISLSVSPIRNAAGEIVGASKIARDITATKVMERQLRHSQKMEAIGQLTGGIAHDFNNLLAIAIGNLGLLERLVAGNEAALTRVQTALRAAGRGADLTRRLLAFSSKETLNPTAILIEDSIHTVIELAGRALGPEIRISTVLDPAVSKVYADAAGLESALLNLVVNARDAMPKGGSLTIHTELNSLDESYPPVRTRDIKPGTYGCVTVTDTGTGMSQETLEHAFEPFFTTKSRDKGTGLGLAMVYGFARQCGGTVRMYSEQDIGTTVCIYLPLAGKPPRPAAEPAGIQSAAGPAGKILVVDDEPDLLEIASAHLTEMGYTVLQAEDSASALKVFMQFDDIDLMVTDVIMPGGMNGVELARRARQLSPRTKVIFSSGFPADALAERSGTAVDGPLLHKPFQRAELASLVRRVMEETMTTGETHESAGVRQRTVQQDQSHGRPNGENQ
jgi:PAS domain S-box-containing protein